MNKDKIIKMAFLELGFPYADEDLQEDVNFETASFYFNDIVLKIQNDTRFNFNLSKERLKLLDRQRYTDRYEYAKPTGFLKNLTPGIAEFGDILLSDEAEVECTYKKKLDLEDIPDTYERLTALWLATAICSSVGKAKAITRLASLMQLEEEKLTFDNGLMGFDLEDLN